MSVEMLLEPNEKNSHQDFSSAKPSSAVSTAAAASSAPPDSASQPSPVSPALPAAQCIGKEFPSGTAYFGRAAPDAAPERSTCRNRRRTFQKRAAGCHRRGNALRPSAPERRNIGPWLTSIFAARIARSNGIKVLAGNARPSISPMFSRFSTIRRLNFAPVDISFKSRFAHQRSPPAILNLASPAPHNPAGPTPICAETPSGFRHDPSKTRPAFAGYPRPEAP